MPSNLKKFNELIKAGKTPSEAALGTFTGENASRLGFKKATVLPSSVKDAKGTYSSVDVVFDKGK